MWADGIMVDTPGSARPTASAARVVFDELTLESFILENTLRAAHAVVPNLQPPPEERLPVRGMKPLEHSKYRRRRRGTPPRRDALRITVAFLHFRACTPPSISQWVDIQIHGESTVYNSKYLTLNMCLKRSNGDNRMDKGQKTVDISSTVASYS
jgi:hypothetical protein